MRRDKFYALCHSTHLFTTQARSCSKTRRDKLWSFCALCQPRGTNSTVSGWCVGTNHFQNFCRFRWQGDSPFEWCFARMKLVSYLYFPFISNKRQVKRGNCHTLISSGDLCLGACNFHLTILRYLAPIVRQFVKFCDMPKLKRKHRCTIREVP